VDILNPRTGRHLEAEVSAAVTPPKLRIICPECSKRFYTRARRGEMAVCYHCQAQIRSTGARTQRPGGRQSQRPGGRQRQDGAA